MQNVVLFWVMYDCWTLLMQTAEGRCSCFWGQARFSTLIKDLSTLEHWGLAFPSSRLGQSMKTKILATWITKVRVSSHVFIHYIPSNYGERGTKHHSESFPPWFLPKHALLHWLQSESHIFKLSKGHNLNPAILIFPAWLANANISPHRTPRELIQQGRRSHTQTLLPTNVAKHYMEDHWETTWDCTIFLLILLRQFAHVGYSQSNIST